VSPPRLFARATVLAGLLCSPASAAAGPRITVAGGGESSYDVDSRTIISSPTPPAGYTISEIVAHVAQLFPGDQGAHYSAAGRSRVVRP
jgi:hypothetical protein